ncbi:MAG: DUF4276 family protein, partial [Puniceicoccales bacterium]|nr:DUF4276 family protein [Puniceicoccales bacterium]
NLLPEEIDDGSETAPSKRILNVIPEYDKVSSGVKITAQITLPVLRQKCRHFDEWIEKLCNLKTK